MPNSLFLFEFNIKLKSSNLIVFFKPFELNNIKQIMFWVYVYLFLKLFL